MKPISGFLLSVLATSMFLPGCGGDGGSSGGGNTADRSNNQQSTEQTGETKASEAFDAHAFFDAHIASRLTFCATCHIPGGVADTDEGRGLILSTQPSQNYDLFYASWQGLGGGVATNPNLVENSDNNEPHTGGKTWPVGSEAYNDVSKLFSCWDDPESCSGNTQPPPTEPPTAELPLIEMGPVKPPVLAGCEGKPADTPLPLDPRKLVKEGINKPGVAVQFNGYWIDLHNPEPPFRQNPLQPPETCGEWLAMVEEGEKYIESTSTFLAGNGIMNARNYRRLWRAWGLTERPANFDDEILKRYGLFKANFRNPYPLEGEDPNLTDGGSGQLPLGLSMLKNRAGKYTGEVSLNCSFCHDSRVGTDEEGQEFYWGRASSSMDLGVFVNDFTKTIAGIPAAVPFPFATNPGVSNALGVIDFLYLLFDAETVSISLGAEFFPLHGSAGQNRAPHWWHRAWMTRLFRGALSSDNVRSTLALSATNLIMSGAERRALEPTFESVTEFLNSLTPPPYPYPDQINMPLAEAGAILFHTKDMWANGANEAIPRPPGNGSCASCHGVYSPRFAADPAMLPDPRLKGVAGVITPIEIIRTDPARTHVMSDAMKIAWNTSWWAYDELNPEWTKEGQGRPMQSIQRLLNDLKGGGDRLEGPSKWSEIVGYSAPPLYGAWAAAPYFHNSSVPTIWGVLKPSDRPDIWLPPEVAADGPGLNTALDNSLAAYDFVKLGWKYQTIPCKPGTERFNCNPVNAVDAVLQMLSNALGNRAWLAYQQLPPLNNKQVEERRIYNTHEFSRGNEGHDFTEMLTDQERYALIEYMKTM